MTDAPNPEKPAEADRIAKVIARAGLASRREAERMVIEGRVSVNGEKITSPALDVLPSDKIKVDGKPLDEPQETRLWLYYKPVGLVTSEADEKGRQTVFDAMPRDMPRVMSVGRLDLNSEGLLLLTNDGELKRRLELPTTGWLRRYRVRVNGRPTDLTFDPLRRGITIEGEDFQPMEVRLDSQQGANAWLTVGIREGRNREIRRAMAHIGLQVNRLIRIGYGPFKLTGMEVNEVRELRRRVLRDQLGGLLTGEIEEKPREFRDRGADADRPRRREDGDRPRRREDGDRSDRREGRGDRPGKPRFSKPDGDRPFRRRDDDRSGRPPREGGDGDRKPRFSKGPGDKPFRRRDDDRPARPAREGGFGEGKPRFSKGQGDKPFRRRDDDRPARPAREGGFGEGKPRFSKGQGDKPFRRRDDDRPARPAREGGFGEGKPRFSKGQGDKPFRRRDDDRPARPAREGGFSEGKPRFSKGQGDKPFRRRDDDRPTREAGGEDRKPRWKSKPVRDGGKDDRGDFRKPRGPREGGRDGGRSFAARGDKPFARRDGAGDGEKRDYSKPRRDGGKPGGKSGFKPRGEGKGPSGPREGGKPGGFRGKPGQGRGPKPGGDRPFGGKPSGKPGGRPAGKPGGGKPRDPRG